ncbi:UDP-2-acetamido-2,6-beta-L-arabino-hexul-4-ose reductase [Paucimonas lemoignei]|uniref:UDP-2-acetamido-2,6-beta-L-arabino-hexul-4-ose reductase n=1 Tax=Paucimonas lemoignei TaxID=29443 RepID=A0A4R3HVQ5_PAULE|nr:NAD-dependent epimerase/dehydratase family protein [Paucimonas lemoignei]TCS35107.1 UDP-2-acetamido-2,6-beta-L-arabino-hexul-4-ose reductase [Paucimonas lemoignei]
MKILITGANGFVGKNLVARLSERKGVEVLAFTRESAQEQLRQQVGEADFIFHLAGINRPSDPAEFITGNAGLTQALCDLVAQTGRQIPIVYASSIQAERDNPYGTSKRAAEEALSALAQSRGGRIYIFRLPNVFGKWCRPNYNSAVATFCYNVCRDLPIQINDPAAPLTLVYIDDVIDHFFHLLDGEGTDQLFPLVEPEYTTTVGEVAELIQSFKDSRQTLITERVGTGLVRALYATYVSYLPPATFSYTVPQYGDPRGVFVEMIKTPDCGQFSYFTAHPGITRGGHYHHTKTEKFLVIKGEARFGFRHIVTDEYYAIETSGNKPEIVETVPGWTHDITNIGQEEMIVMLWANEIFDREHPDTYARPVQHEKT